MTGPKDEINEIFYCEILSVDGHKELLIHFVYPTD
jgi:hypothetical protein